MDKATSKQGTEFSAGFYKTLRILQKFMKLHLNALLERTIFLVELDAGNLFRIMEMTVQVCKDCIYIVRYI